jgi:hypothetical protein
MSTPTLSVWLLLLGSLLGLAGCTDAYLPEAISAPPSYLVVDGFLNSQGVTTIKLSRTSAIAAAASPPTEAGATLFIEEEAGPRFPLAEGGRGSYTSAVLALNPARRYRLHIRTQAGREYASDFVAVKATPPIDNVVWRAESSGLHLFVNTHDASGATQYYRWEYDETWEITPPYSPTVEFVSPIIRPIAVPYPIMCWGNQHSTAIQIDKTTALNQDVVANYPLRQLPPTSERLYTRYSLLVQQHALSREEYEFWDLLRKNTESLGTLFDPQPAQLTGNVHALNSADEAALGFVGAHSVTEKRIFISRNELPAWRVPSGYESCIPPDTVFLVGPAGPLPNPTQILQAAFGSTSGLQPIDLLDNASTGQPDGYTAALRDCIDCRTRGSAVKPSFWP